MNFTGAVAALCLCMSIFNSVPNLTAQGVQMIQSVMGQSSKSEAVAEPSKYIMHAGGITDWGLAGSSSLEAMNHSYRLGYRYIEADFNWTSDGELVGVHDWATNYSQDGKPLSMTQFEQERSIKCNYTSPTLAELAAWTLLHPDVKIVTDIKERNVEGAKVIAERYPALRDQFIVQIYSYAEYDAVKALGFNNIILTVYAMPYRDKTNAGKLRDFALNHKLAGLTFPLELAELPDYINILNQARTPLYVHTVNGAEEQKRLLDLGCYGVYTDYGRG